MEDDSSSQSRGKGERKGRGNREESSSTQKVGCVVSKQGGASESIKRVARLVRAWGKRGGKVTGYISLVQ